MECANKSRNIKNCSCTYNPCPRKGLCCQCVEYHRANNELPGCFFNPQAEKTYDRSVENFIRTTR